MMKLILQEDVSNLGMVGELVTVRDGYGRNFLIPEGKAILASARSIKELDHQKRLAAHRRAKATASAGEHKKKIEGFAVVMTAKVAPPALNENQEPIPEVLQRLFGSITNRDLAQVLHGAGVPVEHRRIVLSEPIRTVGKFTATVRLDGGITASLPFWVIPEGAADVEAEKRRVEAAQEATRKQAEELARAERAKAEAMAAKMKQEAAEAKARADAAKAAEAAEGGAPAAAAAPAEEEAKGGKEKKEKGAGKPKKEKAPKAEE